MHPKNSHPSAFTLVELLVVISIIALLIGILLPAIGKARDQALTTRSAANLRQIGTAHATYSAEWNDNQWTNNPHNVAAYGNTYSEAFSNYITAIGGSSSPQVHGNGQLMTLLGYATIPNGATFPGATPGTIVPLVYAHNLYQMPIHMDNSVNSIGFGWYRMLNVQSFNRYVGGRFYDPVFYAPKDNAVNTAIGDCFERPGEFCINQGNPGHVYWSSYSLSPAALFAPSLWTSKQGEFPQSLNEIFEKHPGALRTPRYSQARYAELKTHVIEHHWLQNRQGGQCNPAIPKTFGSYDGCQPYYFNHGMDSIPQTLYYDGHVAALGVREVIEADTRIKSQLSVSGNTANGLWRRDTPMGVDGYFEELSWGNFGPNTSFHILTNGGILGRDRMPRSQ